MLTVLALAAAERAFNGWLDTDPVARQQLNALSGKTLRIVFDSPQMTLDMLFDRDQVSLTPAATGQAQRPSLFEQRPYDRHHVLQPADTTLHLSDAAALVRLLRQPAGNIPLEGDYKVLQVFQNAVLQAEPDWLLPIQQALGAQPAALLGETVGRGLRFLRQGGQRLTRQAQDWLQQDSALLAPRWQMEQITAQTAELHLQTERLQARLAQLENRLQPPQSDPVS